MTKYKYDKIQKIQMQQNIQLPKYKNENAKRQNRNVTKYRCHKIQNKPELS